MSLSLPSRSDAISEQIVRLYFDALGRGPTSARTYVEPQFVVCVLRDVLPTTEAIDRRCVSIVEMQTGRSVLSHAAEFRSPVDIGVHFFLFDDATVARDGLRH